MTASEVDRRLDRQLTTWRKELLPTDRRQRALYFKHTKVSSLELVTTTAAGTADLIRSGDVTLVPEDPEGRSFPPARGIAVQDKDETALASSMRTLERSSRAHYLDRGFWTLYCGIGMLRWIDPDDQKVIDSPLVLVPVEIKRKGGSFTIRRTADEVVVNPVLALKLASDFEIELPVAGDDLTVRELLDHTHSLIAGRSGWGLLQRSVMTTFSFQKEAMYRDLEENADLVAASDLVQVVALGPDSPTADTFAFRPVSDDQIDLAVPPENLVSILDADGSQRRCILAAREGKSFVMDGPPGTGKSQTIANIIVELMSRGHSVLFVSEKAAALDVVRNRLDDAGLTDFLLELHSHTTTRKSFAQELDRVLDVAAAGSARSPERDAVTLRKIRDQLTQYAAAMNELRPAYGRSLHDLLGKLAELRDAPFADVDSVAGIAEARPELIGGLLADGARLARHWRPVSEGRGFRWRDLRMSEADAGAGRHAATLARRGEAAARTALSRAGDIAMALSLPQPVGRPALQRRLELAQLLPKRPVVPLSWLTGDATNVARARVSELRRGWGELAAVQEQLVGLAGPDWPQLDADQFAAVDWAAIESEGYPTPATHTPGIRDIGAFLHRMDHVVELREDGRKLAAVFRVSPERLTPRIAATLADLAALGSSPALPERAWLEPRAQREVDEAARVLDEVLRIVRERSAAIDSVFTPAALDLDLSSLVVRFRDVHRGLRKFSGAARRDKHAVGLVTVSGKADKRALARLEEAAAWQGAVRTLGDAEPRYAPTLGRYYHGQGTDFARVASAMQTARAALERNGDLVDRSTLAQQVAADGEQDPQLEQLGARVQHAHKQWTALVDTMAPAAAAVLQDSTMPAIAEWYLNHDQRMAPLAELAHEASTIARQALRIRDLRRIGELLEDVTAKQAALFETYAADEELLGPVYAGADTDWSAVELNLAWAAQVRELIGTDMSPATAEALVRANVPAPDALQSALTSWDDLANEFAALFGSGRAGELREEFARDLEGAAETLSAMADSGPGDIEEWREFQQARSRLSKAGFARPVETTIREQRPASTIEPMIERAVLQALADAIVDGDARLKPYQAVDRDDIVRRFRELDRERIARASDDIRRACARARDAALDDPAIAVVRREANKKIKHLAIKELIRRSADIVTQLKPCFMMSPLAVSQFLPPEAQFDTVIFDEASQVLPADAINSLYRGAQLIVAGDQKQLPPTSFFTSSTDDESDGDDEDSEVFESLLDLSKAAGALRSLSLNWHYRSQHESLISYSNHRFYKGQLHTFPGAAYEAPDLGVGFVPVDGVYRRGTSRDNPIEARAVIDRVQFHRRHHPDLSIGVVTFSTAQEDAVVRALEERALEDPTLGDLLVDQDRLNGFFVKSLENVQGDERDIIVFSVGYGSDENGKLTNNFGPINRAGGWRRLNVAITRARRRNEVVCSFRAADMQDSTNESVRHLKSYLDFAERGDVALALDIDVAGGDAESPFEEDVIRTIQQWGYEVVPQVGAAGYRIDIGVKHPTKPGLFALAVECDGAAYHSAKVARDRDRLREQVLRGLGWNVHRIWGLSWYRDRTLQEERLRTAIIDASHGGPSLRDVRGGPSGSYGQTRDEDAS